LRAVSLDAHAFENLTRAHVEKLHVSVGITLFVASDKVFQEVLAVWRVDEETVPVPIARTAGK
jgi:hypothetical protein